MSDVTKLVDELQSKAIWPHTHGLAQVEGLEGYVQDQATAPHMHQVCVSGVMMPEWLCGS